MVGYGGVLRAGPTPPIAGLSVGWNIGSQVGSATVAALPSVSACRIAALGRQKLYWYFSAQTVMRVSAAVRSSIANRRALSLRSSEYRSANRRAMAL